MAGSIPGRMISEELPAVRAALDRLAVIRRLMRANPPSTTDGFHHYEREIAAGSAALEDAVEALLVKVDPLVRPRCTAVGGLGRCMRPEHGDNVGHHDGILSWFAAAGTERGARL